MLYHRDSGMQGHESNNHPDAFINVPAEQVVEPLVAEVRRFRPHVLLTFEPGGLYGHPDHCAISVHATAAFHLAGDPEAFPHQLANGLTPYSPSRLFYSARPRGFRLHVPLNRYHRLSISKRVGSPSSRVPIVSFLRR